MDEKTRAFIGCARPPSKRRKKKEEREEEEEEENRNSFRFIIPVPSKVSEKYTLAETERVALAKTSATATNITRARRGRTGEEEEEEEGATNSVIIF
jgi:hypothetical protein